MTDQTKLAEIELRVAVLEEGLDAIAAAPRRHNRVPARILNRVLEAMQAGRLWVGSPVEDVAQEVISIEHIDSVMELLAAARAVLCNGVKP